MHGEFELEVWRGARDGEGERSLIQRREKLQRKGTVGWTQKERARRLHLSAFHFYLTIPLALRARRISPVSRYLFLTCRLLLLWWSPFAVESVVASKLSSEIGLPD